MGRIGLARRFRLMKQAGFKCQYCGRSASEVTLEIDHIVPRAKGGLDNDENLCVACFDCNHGKRDHPLTEQEQVNPHKTKPVKASRPTTGLVGMFFHTFDDDGAVDRQGHIVKEVQPGMFLVEYFSWLTGTASATKLLALSELQTAQLYVSSQDMHDAWEYHHQFHAKRRVGA